MVDFVWFGLAYHNTDCCYLYSASISLLQSNMRTVTLTPLLAGIGYALPQAARSCYTTTEQVIVPTTTYTYSSTYVTSITATTPMDQGTFTEFTRVSSTTTLETITQTENDCSVYVSSMPSHNKD